MSDERKREIILELAQLTEEITERKARAEKLEVELAALLRAPTETVKEKPRKTGGGKRASRRGSRGASQGGRRQPPKAPSSLQDCVLAVLEGAPRTMFNTTGVLEAVQKNGVQTSEASVRTTLSNLFGADRIRRPERGYYQART